MITFQAADGAKPSISVKYPELWELWYVLFCDCCCMRADPSLIREAVDGKVQGLVFRAEERKPKQELIVTRLWENANKTDPMNSKTKTKDIPCFETMTRT